MKYPELPEPVIVEGRMLFTKSQMREYGKLCFEYGQGLCDDVPLTENHGSDNNSLYDVMFGKKK